MANVKTTFGTRANDNVDMTNVTGSGPLYTVTLSAAPPVDTVVGDTLSDEKATPAIYLITAIAGAVLTVSDVLGAGAAPSEIGGSQSFTARTDSGPQAWEDGHDDTTLYASGDIAEGIMKPDSVFDEAVTIDNAGTASLTSILWTVSIGDRHDGTAGNGSRFVMTTDARAITWKEVGRMEWVEIDQNGNRAGLLGEGDKFQTFAHIIFHDQEGNITTMTSISMSDGGGDVIRCLVYGLKNTSGASGAKATGINLDARSADVIRAFNSVVFRTDVTKTGTTGPVVGINGGLGIITVKNCISMDNDNAGDGGEDDFGSGIDTQGNNISEDGTASGTGSQTNKDKTTQFENITDGSEDFHILETSDAFNNGEDLGTSPAGVNIDIDDFDLDADTSRDPWDVGVHERESVSAAFFNGESEFRNQFKGEFIGEF